MSPVPEPAEGILIPESASGPRAAGPPGPQPQLGVGGVGTLRAKGSHRALASPWQSQAPTNQEAGGGEGAPRGLGTLIHQLNPLSNLLSVVTAANVHGALPARPTPRVSPSHSHTSPGKQVCSILTEQETEAVGGKSLAPSQHPVSGRATLVFAGPRVCICSLRSTEESGKDSVWGPQKTLSPSDPFSRDLGDCLCPGHTLSWPAVPWHWEGAQARALIHCV